MPGARSGAKGNAKSDGPWLSARGVSVEFGGLTALQHVDLDVWPGEVLGLIGPNGAGKTTLVNVLSGFQRPTSGAVLLDDSDITRWAPARRCRNGVVRTFQAVRLFPDLSVAENLQAAAVAAGRPVGAAREQAAALLAEFGLAEFGPRPASGLPHGVERRVGLLRALATNPRVLMLDEPAAGLDERESDELGAVLQEIRASYGCAVVIIEHDMRLVMSRCDRLHVLASGATLAIGDPATIRDHPAVVEAYLGAAE